MKTLVVDDSATMRHILVNTLRRIGVTDSVQAEDGLDALSKFDPSIDFVITDWNMPRMTGIDFVRELRARPAGATVPVLMITTRGLSDDVAAALAAGADDFIVKPFAPAGLREKIDRLTSGDVAATITTADS